MPATAEKRLAVYAHTFAFLHGIKQDEVMRIQTEDEKSGPIKELSLVHDLAEEADAMVQDPDRCRAFKEKMRCALTPSKDVGVTELMMRAQNYQAMHEALNALTKNNKDVESARAFFSLCVHHVAQLAHRRQPQAGDVGSHCNGSRPGATSAPQVPLAQGV